MSGSPEAACHDLLVRLAGRLPDEPLWRLRDWLACGARRTVAGMLPRLLLRERVGITTAEHDLLARAVEGGPSRLVDAVATVVTGPIGAPAFRPVPEPPDATALSVCAVVRGHPGCTGLALARRVDAAREQDIWLVQGGKHPWELTGTLQRVVRAHGDRTPCIEVLVEDVPAVYHRVASGAATPLWRLPTRPAESPAAGAPIPA